jgi:hypothetical protein
MSKATKKKLTIKQICAKPANYVGRVVTLEGIFLGWRLGKCHFPPGAETTSPKTRSDWLIGTGSDCAYVTGGAPAGVSPANLADIGCRIEITGMVALSEDGGVYFEFRKGRRLAPKTASKIKTAA